VKKRLKALSEQWTGCKKCELHNDRPSEKIVFGLGKSTAKYLLLFDTPTENDAYNALPMSGSEGDLLVELLEKAGMSLEEVYCTPLVACRPVVFLPETVDQKARVLDRAPNAEELLACSPRIREIIYQIDPLVIFTMGDVTWKAMVRAKDRGTSKSLDKAIGDLFLTRLPGRWVPEITYDVIPLMSMRQIVAQPSFAAHGPLSTTARHLHKGRVYAEFIEKTGQRDSGLAGFKPEEHAEAGAPSRTAGGG
jgi:uracil-DNA glycosylase family 4